MILLAALGTAPDLDLLVGAHNAQSHSLGAAVVVGVLGALILWRRGRISGGAHLIKTAAVFLAAYSSHVLLDWLNSDASPPVGIMALWPVSDRYYRSELTLFDAISRRYDLPGFWWRTLRAVTRELMLLGPLGVLAWWWATREPSGRAAAARQNEGPSGRS